MARRMALFGAALCAVGFCSYIAALPVKAASPDPETGGAFTAVSVKIFEHSVRGQLMKETSVFGLRGDGSFVHSRRKTALGATATASPITEATSRRVFDVAKGRETVVEDTTKSTTTAPIGSGAQGSPPGLPFGPCPPTGEHIELQEDPPGLSHLGYAVSRYVETRPTGMPGLTLRREGSFAPALGCLPMIEEMTVTDANGSVVTRTSLQVEAVIPGEPSASLFVVPDGYTERMPSEVLAEWAETEGRPCTDCVLRTGQIWDEAHRQRQRDALPGGE